MPPAWYEEYFSEPYGEIYSEYLLPASVAREEAQLACDALELKPGDRILDCPCGYGRHMDFLHRLFPDIIGIDLDRDCLKRGKDYSPDLKMLRGDMRELPFRAETFDAVINLFNSFGYFSQEENMVTLRQWHRVMKSGAGLMIDVANPEPLIDIITEHPRTQQEVFDLLLTEDWNYEPESGLLHNRTEIHLAGETKVREYSLRIYSLDELQEMLTGADMVYETAYGEFDGDSYDPDESTRLIVTARKAS